MLTDIDKRQTAGGFKSSMLNCPKNGNIYLGETCEKCKYCVAINSLTVECSFDWRYSSTKVLKDKEGNEYTFNRYKFNKFVKDCLTKEV